MNTIFRCIPLKRKYLFLIVCFGLLFASCSKDNPPHIPPPPTEHGNGVFIAHEGTYMSGNATLSFYDNSAKTVENQIFYNVNDVPLGDVCQSMVIRGKTGFAVINNSGKVYAMDTDTFIHKGTITGLNSPRYIHFVSDTKAYISSLYNPSMTIFNPQTLAITGSIEIGTRLGPGGVYGTEQMIGYGDYVFVCSWSYNNRIFRIDTRADQVVDWIEVTKQPNSIVLDKNNKLWVLSDGGYAGSPYWQEHGALTRIDAATFTIEEAFPFPDISSSPQKLVINTAGDRLYFINGRWKSITHPAGGVYMMNVEERTLPATPLIAEADMCFYGLGVDPRTNEIYVSDAIDYVQWGWVMRYTQEGTLVDRFKTDVTPGSFCFKYD